jgi:hypothetical protein
MFKKIFSKFWNWYSSNKFLNTGLVAGLFILQLVHLYWLTTDVVFFKLFGKSFLELQGFWQILILVVDYTEIPALILTSVFYLNEYREGRKIKSLLYLFFINSQWLHIFWITDEFVVEQLLGVSGIGMPTYLAFIAIGIDYLELPVIYDTIKNFVKIAIDRINKKVI